jgi:hypothetical protein
VRVDNDVFDEIIKYTFKEIDDFLIYRVDTNEYFKKFEKINID